MITKQVVLQWDEDGECWHDQETGVQVTGVADPDTSIPQFVEAGHRSLTSNRIATYEQVQQMIDDAFQRRIVGGSTLHYFADPLDDNLIVPYSYHLSLSNRIAALHDRLMLIENEDKRTWWKLW